MIRYLLSNAYYNAIPEDDLISKQRYKLFRTFSLAGFLVCFLFTIQTVSLFNISNPVVFFVTGIGMLLAANFYLLTNHKNE